MHAGEKSDNLSTQSNLNLLRWNEELKGSFLTLFREKLAISRHDISRQINENIETAFECITKMYVCCIVNSTCIVLLRHGFVLVKRWRLIMCDT